MHKREHDERHWCINSSRSVENTPSAERQQHLGCRSHYCSPELPEVCTALGKANGGGQMRVVSAKHEEYVLSESVINVDLFLNGG